MPVEHNRNRSPVRCVLDEFRKTSEELWCVSEYVTAVPGRRSFGELLREAKLMRMLFGKSHVTHMTHMRYGFQLCSTEIENTHSRFCLDNSDSVTLTVLLCHIFTFQFEV